MPERGADRRLRIGMRLWEIAVGAARVHTLREVTLPYLEDLVEVVRSPTLLSVLDRNDVVDLETLTPRRSSAPNITRLGMRLPLWPRRRVSYCPPSGHLPYETYILTHARTTRFSPHTVVDRAELRMLVAETRRVGHLIARGWMWADSIGVAVPIPGTDGSADAALSVTTSITNDSAHELLPAMHTTARGVARAVRTGNLPSDPDLAVLERQVRRATEIA
jgi:DNA-binding IclR family transcriptional regulator